MCSVQEISLVQYDFLKTHRGDVRLKKIEPQLGDPPIPNLSGSAKLVYLVGLS